MKKPIAIVILLAFIALWIVVAGTIGTRLGGAPNWVQLVFYVIAGLGWVFPLKPLFAWMNRKNT